MADKIYLRRGNKADLPVLGSGEPGFATDTKQLFIGSPTGNAQVAMSAQEAWIAPTLVNGWIVANVSFPPTYFKDGFGNVWLRGRVANGTINQTIFTLPFGYRPSQAMFIPVLNNGVFGFLTLNTNGSVTLETGSTAYVQLDSVAFHAEL